MLPLHYVSQYFKGLRLHPEYRHIRCIIRLAPARGSQLIHYLMIVCRRRYPFIVGGSTFTDEHIRLLNYPLLCGQFVVAKPLGAFFNQTPPAWDL